MKSIIYCLSYVSNYFVYVIAVTCHIFYIHRHAHIYTNVYYLLRWLYVKFDKNKLFSV